MPLYPSLLANLAVALRAQGRLEEALGLFRQVLRHRPEDGGMLTQLGNVLQELGEVEEGNACFRSAIDADPDHAEARDDSKFVTGVLAEAVSMG